MPQYLRACAICLEMFESRKVNTTYCSKKCANKARSYPGKILQALLEKTGKTLQVVDTVPTVVREYLSKNTKTVNDLAKLLNLPKSELSVIEQEGLRLKNERIGEAILNDPEAVLPTVDRFGNPVDEFGNRIKTENIETIKINGEEVEIDTEMRDFKLRGMEKPDEYINTPANSADIHSVTSTPQTSGE